MDINRIALVLANGDTEQAEIKAYYIKGMIHVGSTISIILAAGYLLNVIQYALIILFTLRLIRTKTGGCHSESITLCKVITFSIVLGLALLAPVVKPSYLVFLIWSLVILVFGLYMIHKVAPLDSPKRPIVSQDFRRELKFKSYIFFVLLMAVIYIFSYYGYLVEATSILLALSIHFFLMTKLGYWLMAKVDSFFIGR